jgi:hypothetical protein
MRSRRVARNRDVYRKSAPQEPHCNNCCPSFAPRESGAPRSITMEIVALVMPGPIVLFLLQQVWDFTS